MKPVQEEIARGATRSRRQEVAQRLAAFGLVRGPRRLMRGASETEEGRARRLRAALESLGPVFASFGLYLSTRVDLLPAPGCLELAAIRDRAAPSSPAAVRSLVAGDLGRAPEEAFSWFDERTFESRLLSQSHLARLTGGQEVVVKLIRPEAEEHLRHDLELLPLLKDGLVGEAFSGAAFESAVEDFCATLRCRSDLTEEARVFEALVQDEREFGMIRVPAVYGELCTNRLLTTERLPGSALSDGVRPARPKGGASWPAHETAEREDLAHRLCVVWLRQAFLGSFFPAEPSADNIVVVPGGQIAFTGGFFASLPPRPRENLRDYLVAVAADDPDRAYSCLFTELKREGRPAERDDLRQRFRQIVPVRDGGWTMGGGNSLAEYLFAHWRLAGERDHLPLPHLPPFYRGLFTLAQVAYRLAPERDVFAEALQHARLLSGVEKFRDMVDPRLLGTQLEQYVPLLMGLPQKLDEVLSLAAEGQARLRLQVPESSERRRGKDSAALFLVMLLVLAAFALLSHRVAASLPAAWADGFNAVVFVALGALLLRAGHRP
jgi:ubiquinone biosynthesis protein